MKKGFSYYLTREQIEEYKRWPVERRLRWLYYGNKLRRMLPKRIVELQEAFRQGRI